jgi:hypothetical protein
MTPCFWPENEGMQRVFLLTNTAALLLVRGMDNKVGHHPRIAPTVNEHIIKVLITSETRKERCHTRPPVSLGFLLEPPHNYSFSRYPGRPYAECPPGGDRRDFSHTIADFRARNASWGL